MPTPGRPTDPMWEVIVSPTWQAFSNLPPHEGALESITQCLEFPSSIPVVGLEVFHQFDVQGFPLRSRS